MWDGLPPSSVHLWSGYRMPFQLLPLKLSIHSPIKGEKEQIKTDIPHHFAQVGPFVPKKDSILRVARLSGPRHFALAGETQEIINMTCQTIEHNDFSLIPSAQESLMFLLQKINVLHAGAARAGVRRGARSESTSDTCWAETHTHTDCVVLCFFGHSYYEKPIIVKCQSISPMRGMCE